MFVEIGVIGGWVIDGMFSGEIEECSSYQADFKDLRYSPSHQVIKL